MLVGPDLSLPRALRTFVECQPVICATFSRIFAERTRMPRGTGWLRAAIRYARAHHWPPLRVTLAHRHAHFAVARRMAAFAARRESEVIPLVCAQVPATINNGASDQVKNVKSNGGGRRAGGERMQTTWYENGTVHQHLLAQADAHARIARAATPRRIAAGPRASALGDKNIASTGIVAGRRAAGGGNNESKAEQHQSKQNERINII